MSVIADRFLRIAFCATLALGSGVANGYVAPAALAATATPVPATAVTKAVEFPTAQAGVTALIDALRRDDMTALAQILGPGSEHLLNSGDATADAAQIKEFLASYDTKHALVATDSSHVTLDVGNDAWPLPIPLVQVQEAWHFDAAKGAQQIVDRRIGRNEIAAVRTCLAFVDAQLTYFDLFKEVTGTGAYAQRLVSTMGNYDGLYWPQAPGIPESPLQPLVSQALDEGYPGEIVSGKLMPYHGYYFRILTSQGPDAPGGEQSYLEGTGRMTGGFALLAWPSLYGSAGIMSFEVNENGVVFQKDLGPDTSARAAKIKQFNPDFFWTRIDVSPQ